MALPPITYRRIKGSPLTADEVDGNFENLDSRATESASQIGGVTDRVSDLETSTTDLTTRTDNLASELAMLDNEVTQDVSALESGKVDKVPGKQLTDENFTLGEKDKLAGLESSKFKGQFVSLAALSAAFPSGEIGWYANVDPGTGTAVQRALWDSNDNEWVLSGSGGGQMTPAQIREGYLANPDTNNFSDADKAKLASTEVFTTGEKSKLATVQADAAPNYPAMDQATAEAGTSTSLLSVTALRIRQAILAWWNNSSAKTKLDGIPPFPPADGKSYVFKDGAWVEAAALQPVIMSGQIGSALYSTSQAAPFKIPFADFKVISPDITYDSVNRRFYINKSGVYRVMCSAYGLLSSNRLLIGLNTDTPTTSLNEDNVHGTSESALRAEATIPISSGQYLVFYFALGALYNQAANKYGGFSIEKVG